MRNAGAVIHSHGMESCLVTMLNPQAKEFRVSRIMLILQTIPGSLVELGLCILMFLPVRHFTDNSHGDDKRDSRSWIL